LAKASISSARAPTGAMKATAVPPNKMDCSALRRVDGSSVVRIADVDDATTGAFITADRSFRTEVVPWDECKLFKLSAGLVARDAAR
jgi:hypothetical protein